MAMQGMMEEVKRFTAKPELPAAPERPAASATHEPSHTREVPVSQVSLTESDPLQQPGKDAWLKYAQAHGPGAPMPAGLPGPWASTRAAPLNPIHPKDVSKPKKYGGNTDDWLQWSKTFKQFLDGKDPRWERLLDDVKSINENDWEAKLETRPLEHFKK